MSKRTGKILLVAFWVCFALAAAVACMRQREPLSYILDSVTEGQLVYGIDDDEKQVRFFVADKGGKVEKQFTIDRQEGSVYWVFDYLSLDNDGKLYVYGIKIDAVTNQYLDESVYFCNFEEGKLELYQTLPMVYKDGQNNMSVNVEDGNVTYLTYEFLDQLVVTVYKIDQSGTVSQIHQTFFDSMINIYDYAYSDEWNLVFITPNNKVYHSLPDGTVKQVYPTDGELHQLTDFYYDGGDLVYVTDVALGKIVQINLKSETHTMLYDTETILNSDTYYYSDLEKIKYKDGDFSATVQIDHNTSGLGLYQDGEFYVIQSLQLQIRDCIKIFLYTFLLLLVGALVLFAIGKLFFYITKHRYPILAKLIFSLIPIVIISTLITRYYTQRNMTTELINAQYRELYQNSRNFLAGVESFYWTDIEPQFAYETPEYFDFQNIFFNRGTGSVELMGDVGEKSSNIDYFSYIFAYKVKDGKLYSYYCDPQPVNAPVEYKQSKDMTELFYQCVEQAQPVKGQYRDKFGNWSVVLVPVYDQDYNVVAVLETGMSKVLVDYNISQEIRELTIVNLVIMAGMMVVISLILKYCLYPLKRLKKGVEEMRDGNFGVTVPVRGRDEIAEISEVFNRMSFNIQGHIQEIEKFNRASFRFIPSPIFMLLKKEGVADIQKGDNTTKAATAFCFHTVTFNTKMRTMTGEQMYGFINKILSVTVPAVVENRGVISEFQNAGIEGFFIDSSEFALNCAISMCHRLMPLEKEEGFEGIKPAIGLSYGQTKLGIVGTDQRLEAVAISESTNLAQFLQKIAPKYSSKILVTGNMLEQIPQWKEKYHIRWIGFLSLSATGTMEKIYDCYDGDEMQERKWKDETKEMFERGVELYCSRSYYEARKMFIEVLKKVHRDDAAKEYLFRCDWQLHHKTNEQNIYLEQY